MPDQNSPNPAANKEPAEGSRETVLGGRGTREPAQGGRERPSDEPRRPLPSGVDERQGAEHGSGITNRPLDEERRSQDAVPPREEPEA